MRALLLVLLLLTGGCEALPRDPDGTLEQVRSRGAFRVGLVASADSRPTAEARFLARVTQLTGARPAAEQSSAEDLLARLEAGELDLVVGEFHADSPWAKRVTFVPPLDGEGRGPGRLVLAAAARNGENAWIAVLHKAAADLEPRP